ncbi:universal stress protein [Dehalogenimonas sp. THU2]|uniref:universal stress protein n=1 Tax=Dehalogenimonas sp. THU2 TaxID=3151121 RepID=UPI0032184404
MFRKILVPLDGSPTAETVLPCAEEIAGRMGSQITLLGVLDYGAVRYEHLYRCYLEGRAGALERRIRESGGPDVTVTPLLVREKVDEDLVCEEPPGITLGHPAGDIVGAAASQGTSLILMASHGHSGLRRLALASVTDAIVRGCGLPVLIVRPESRVSEKRGEICRNIVVPLDGSAMAEKALRVVEEMADKMCGQGMKVNLIHVAPERRVATTDEPSPDFLEHVADPAWCKAGDKAELYFKQAEEYLKKAGGKLEAGGVAVSHVVRIGKPDEEISRLAAETGSSMVVMTCHARTGLSRYLMGSVADRILHSVEASVLLLRPDKPQPAGLE